MDAHKNAPSPTPKYSQIRLKLLCVYSNVAVFNKGDDYKFDISPRNGGIRIYMGLSRPTVTFSQNTAWKFGKLVSVQNFKLHEKIA